MVLTLLGAVVVSALLGYWNGVRGNFVVRFGDPLAILFIVTINATLGLFQESRANAALSALKQLTAPKSRVIRDGQHQALPSRELLPGDVVLLEEGDAIPADLRFIEALDLLVAEAALTGESTPVKKRSAPAVAASAPLAERVTAGFMGTNVLRGRGSGIVYAVGAQTELGQIAGMLAQLRAPKTPLQINLARFGKWVVVGCLAICVVVFLVGFFLESAPVHVLFMGAVSLAVAAIPEGLPAITTISMALGTKRMARRKAIVRQLPAVETLGCTEVICTDKTGTLTSNAMTVRRFWLAGRQWRVSGGAKELTGEFEEVGQPRHSSLSVLLPLLWAAGTAQGAKVQRHPDGSLELLGDPTELALVVFARKGGIQASAALVVDQQPFSSELRMSATLINQAAGPVAYLRGAVEQLLERSVRLYTPSGERPLTKADIAEIMAVQESYAQDGLRILGLALRAETPKFAETGSKRTTLWQEELTFLGVVGLLDPPRPEVAPALAKAKEAGIQIMMITGDLLLTAKAIAKELHLWQEGTDLALTGAELDKKSDQELGALLPRLRLVARATPANKLRIIQALSRNKTTAAMTGDGVNDAPAVRAAPIGIAMGLAGTDVTREAADLVLSDDNFATIIAAVEEGRAIYQNIRKFIFFMLSSNAGLVFAILAASLLGWPVLLSPIQILWINLITNGLPALALGADPPEAELMKQRPRRSDEPLLSGGEYLQVALVGLMFAGLGILSFWEGAAYLQRGEVSLALLFQSRLSLAGFSAQALASGQAVAFTVLALGPVIYSFSCRSKWQSLLTMSPFKNPALWGAALLALALQAVALYVPFLRPLFKVPPLGIKALAFTAILCVIPLVAVEIGKLLLRPSTAWGKSRSAGASA